MVSMSVTLPTSSIESSMRRCARTTEDAPRSPVNFRSSNSQHLENPTGCPCLPRYRGKTTSVTLKACATANRVLLLIKGKSPGKINHPDAWGVDFRDAPTAAAIESPIPGCPASSICQGKPQDRTASNVCWRIVFLPRSVCSLWVVPPDAMKRSPRPEASINTTGGLISTCSAYVLLSEYQGTFHFRVTASSARIGVLESQSATTLEGEVP